MRWELFRWKDDRVGETSEPVSHTLKVFPPHIGSCSPRREQWLVGKRPSWRGMSRVPAPWETLSSTPYSHSCAIFNGCTHPDVKPCSLHSYQTHVRTWVYITATDLLPHNCNCKIAFEDRKTKTKQKTLLLGADSGGLGGPALARGSVWGIQPCDARRGMQGWVLLMAPRGLSATQKKKNSSCIIGIVGGN